MDTYIASLPDRLPVRERSEPVLRLLQLTQLLRRHLWLVALCAVLAGAGAFIYAHSLPKEYTANGLMTVEGDRFAIPELQGALRSDSSPDPMPFVHTEVQALTSRAMVSQVSRELHLQDNPEFNADLRAPTLTQRVKGLIGSAVASFLPKPSLSGDGTAAASDDGVVGAVTQALSVFQDNRSLVISISFVSQDPALAARVVNTLISDYVAGRARHRGEANAGANTVIEARVDQARKDLADIEQKMADMRSKGDVIGVRAGSIGQQQVEELTTAAARATLERSQLEVSYQRAAAAAKQGSSDALASVLNSPTISRLRDAEAQSSNRMAQLSSHYGPDYPGMRSASAELASTRRQISDEAGRIVSSLGAQLKVARDQEADVRQQLDQARKGAVSAENSRAQLDQLQQEAASRRSLYQTLLERSQQTVAQPAASQTPDVRVLSPAVPPGFPSGPHVMLAGLLGGSGGALLGCLLALTQLRSLRGFERAEDVTSATGMLVLATISPRLIRRDQGVLALRPGRVDVDGQDVEAMRVLRHRLRYAGRTGVPRTALFVPEVGELLGTLGAPLAAPLAAAFARAAAADGERVLLIEGDLQSPKLGQLLGQPHGRKAASQEVGGILAVLSGSDWRDMLVADRQPGLDLLLATGKMANAYALLNDVEFQNLLVEARSDYDLVVLHAPPAPTSNAATLVQRADAAILVIDGKVDRAAAQEAASRLSAVAQTPLVAILLQRT